MASPASLPGERFEFMQTIGPFGKDNPTPTLLMRGARVVRQEAHLVAITCSDAPEGHTTPSVWALDGTT